MAVTHGAGLAIVAYGAGLTRPVAGLGLGLEWCGIRRGVRVRVRVAVTRGAGVARPVVSMMMRSKCVLRLVGGGE